MPIYTGPNSVYGRKHGVYCPGPGVNVKTARCILNMIDTFNSLFEMQYKKLETEVYEAISNFQFSI